MSQTQSLQIVIAQINLLVGAIENNQQHVIDVIQSMDKEAIDVIVFPELTLTSYPPEDLLLRAALYQKIDDALANICDVVDDIHIVIGYPKRGKR